jgi:hypothetical protein
VSFVLDDLTSGSDNNKLVKLQTAYTEYKNNYALNLEFNPTRKDMSMDVKQLNITKSFFSDSMKTYPKLQFVHIHFGTATYDKIAQDMKVTLVGQLGLIGGTMGLLTGFSILSGVEIVYFAVKFLMSLGKTRTRK